MLGPVARRSVPIAAAAGVGYLLGTFPSADLAGRAAGGIDLRSTGSGNPGAANAIDVLGKRLGIAVLVADIGKGALASAIGRAIAGGPGGHIGATTAVVGHCFPVWNGFRGGKGVGTSVGQCLATFPVYMPIDLAVAVVTAAPHWKQRAFVATSVSSACWVAGGFFWWRKRLPNLWGPTPTMALPLSSAVSSAVIAYKFATARRP